MAAMRCSVATPDRALFEGEVAYAGVPGADGSYGVLPGHELMLSLNAQGGVLTLHVGEDGQDHRDYLIMGGATQVFDDRVTVLARFGTLIADIDADAVRAELEEVRAAIAALQQKDDDEQDKATLDTATMRQKWLELQLDYANGKAQ